ncbi:MAG TPA: lysylphosphatidylglycerol synthase transmembrane domain-containing protein [Acidimicrobiales bacterium]
MPPDRPTPSSAPSTGEGATVPDPASRPGRRTLAASALVGATIGLTCATFVAQRMASQWAEVRDAVAGASLGWIAAAVVLAGAAMTWTAACWQRAMRLLGAEPSRRRTIAWYYAGEIGKYVPGGVWPVLGRGELARRGGVSRRRAYPSIGLSLAGLYLAGLGVATALVPLDLAEQSESPGALALLALLPIGLAALHPSVLRLARRLLVRITGRGADLVVPPWRATVGLVAAYVPAWLLVWGATWCTARALVPDPPLLRIGIAATLSWVAGFVAVPVPAGAGVREAVFVASCGLPAAVGATVAVGSRLAFLLVDAGGAALTAPWHRRPPASGPAGPAPETGRSTDAEQPVDSPG